MRIKPQQMSIEDFDPNGTGQDNGNYFGLPFTPEESQLVLLSVPWDVTVSYGEGARFGPDAIIGASGQLDLYEPLNPGGWRRGIGTLPINYRLQELSQFLRDDATKVIKHLEHGGQTEDEYVVRKAAKIDEACAGMNKYVYEQSQHWLSQDKIVGLVGGDHSTPLGLIKALAEAEGAISVLHIDAHADLRPGYEGFRYSHAAIMYNVMSEAPGVESLVQVGIRDLCDCEADFARENPKIAQFTDYAMAGNRFRGMTWDEQCEQIIGKLGEKVYISFDIDGLAPENAPHTGTPVPGGLGFNEAVWLIDRTAAAGKRIVGFDVCEVSPHHEEEWDGNVGARILYKLCNIALRGRG